MKRHFPLGVLALAGTLVLILGYISNLADVACANVSGIRFQQAIVAASKRQQWPWGPTLQRDAAESPPYCSDDRLSCLGGMAQTSSMRFRAYLARCAMLRGDWAAARDKWLEALEIEPANRVFLLGLGRACYLQEDVECALVAWQLAGAVQMLVDYGNEQLAAEAWDSAERAFRSATQVDETCVAAHMGLGRVLYRRDGNRDAAEREWLLAMKLNFGNPWPYVELAEMYQKQGDFPIADLWHRRAILTVDVEKAREAGLRRRAGRNLVWWGQMLLAEGYVDQAADRFQIAHQWDSQSGLPLVYLGRIALSRESLVEAQGWFSQAAVSEDAAAMGLFGLGQVYYEQGNSAAAQVEVERAVALDPGNVEFRLFLGDLYRDLGRKDAALEQYRDVLRLDPDNTSARDRLAQLEADGYGGTGE